MAEKRNEEPNNTFNSHCKSIDKWSLMGREKGITIVFNIILLIISGSWAVKSFAPFFTATVFEAQDVRNISYENIISVCFSKTEGDYLLSYNCLYMQSLILNAVYLFPCACSLLLGLVTERSELVLVYVVLNKPFEFLAPFPATLLIVRAMFLEDEEDRALQFACYCCKYKDTSFLLSYKFDILKLVYVWFMLKLAELCYITMTHTNAPDGCPVCNRKMRDMIFEIVEGCAPPGYTIFSYHKVPGSEEYIKEKLYKVQKL